MVSQFRESDLVSHAMSGSIEAFQDLFHRYKNPVFHFVWRMLGQRQDAEDVVQEVFVKVYRNLSRLREIDGFSSWLFGIAKNETLNHLRKKGRRGGETGLEEAGEEIHPVGPLNPEQHSSNAEMERCLQTALAQLPVHNRAAFVLGVIQGYSYKEVAEILGCTVNHVKTRVFRARTALSKTMRPYFRPGKVAMP